METPMPKNWNCLVQRAEEKALCWTKERKQHSKVRTQWHTAHNWGPLHLAPRGKTLPSVAKPTWVVHSVATPCPAPLSAKLFYSFRLLFVFHMNVFWPLYFFPIQNEYGGQGSIFHRENCLPKEKEINCDCLNFYWTGPGNKWKPGSKK